MAYGKLTAPEIDRKLREDFRRRLHDYGVSSETTDPVLTVLFRTFAVQLEQLYSESERIRLALLDELIAGLGIEGRLARPAQTIVRFATESGSQFLDAGTELIGEAQSGERLTFLTDAAIQVSTARIVMGLVYQGGNLRILPAVEMPEAMQSARPSMDPVRVNLGANPALFLAVEGLPPSHLGQHGLYFEVSPYAEGLLRALRTETWCLAGNDGEFGARGILRPRRANAGLRRLVWLLKESSGGAGPEDEGAEHDVPVLPDGFYGGRVFSLPPVSADRRTLCRMPKGMEGALGTIFGRGAGPAFEPGRAWIRLSMPADVPDLVTGVTGVSLHAVSASEIECLNQTIVFDKHGTSVPVSREGGTRACLVAPLSVIGERGGGYLPELEPSFDPRTGRYAIRNGRIHIQPARHPDGSVDTHANVRLWVTSGSVGNKVGAGQIQAFLKKGTAPSLRITQPTSAAGGTDGESYAEAQARFAEVLLSRERLVTRADMIASVRAFDRRVRSVDVESGAQRTEQGLRRVQRVRLILSRTDFTDPDEESRILREDLTRHLQERFLYDVGVAVEMEWEKGA